jgi:hypothetical protein
MIEASIVETTESVLRILKPLLWVLEAKCFSDPQWVDLKYSETPESWSHTPSPLAKLPLNLNSEGVL